MATPAHDPYRALRSRDYRWLLTGSVLAAIGVQMQSVAVLYEIDSRTHNAAYLGFVGLAQFLPVLLLTLPAGQAADRWSRKRLLLASQVLQLAASLGLAYLSFTQGPLIWIYGCMTLVGIGRAFSAPTRWALAAQVVPPESMHNAVTWYSSGWQLAFVAGPALGGLIIATIAPAMVYVLAAGCALASVGLIASIKPRPRQGAIEAPSVRALLAGIGFVWKTKPILATITLDLFAVLLGGATALLPIFARTVLEVDGLGLGLLRAAPAAGAIVMAIALAHLPPLRRPGKAMLIAVAGFGGATIVFGLSENYFLSLAMLILTGALDNISVVVRGTLVQVLTPESMRGRVSAVNSFFIGSSNELGEFESGITAKWFGLVPSVVGGGIGTLGVVATVMWLWPEVMKLGPLHEIHEPKPT